MGRSKQVNEIGLKIETRSALACQAISLLLLALALMVQDTIGAIAIVGYFVWTFLFGRPTVRYMSNTITDVAFYVSAVAIPVVFIGVGIGVQKIGFRPFFTLISVLIVLSSFVAIRYYRKAPHG